MADVIMPQMGESIAEGTVTKWLKNVGDRVERDEPLFEISTDKVDAEIPSPAAGVLREIRVAPGTTVPINTVVGVIAAEGEAAAVSPPPTVAPPPPAPALVAAPAAARPAAPAPPRRPRGARRRVPHRGRAARAPLASATRAREASVRDDRRGAAPRALLARGAQDRGRAPGRHPRHPGHGHRRAGHQAGHPRPHRDPAGRSRAARAGGHATSCPASAGCTRGSPTGRRTGGGHAAAPPPTAAPAAPALAPGGSRVEIVPMSPIRRKTAEHMVLSKRTSAHVSTVFEIDMTRVDQLRQKHKAAFEERGVRLTYTPFVLKAVVDALKAFPVLNASIDGETIVYHKDINLGLAVALDWGLIVPVIHHADEKNVLGLARAVNDLADRARGKKLKVEEVQGGTFTVTNPGVFGSLFGTPIIPQPQVAILATGTIEKRPVVRDDAIAIRTMCYFCLTFDHRLVDGADADRFMAHVKKILQEFDEAAL